MSLAEPTTEPASARMSQAERTALSDRRMYLAAMELICEHGTHNTTLKDVGERAGYSRGLASNRFGSKESLFKNLVTEFNREWTAELRKFIGKTKGLPAFLAALEAVEDFLMNQSIYMKSMYILWYESISSHGEIRLRLAEHHETARRDIETWMKQGIADGTIDPEADPRLTANQFCAFVYGTVYQWLIQPEAIDIRANFQYYRRNILRAIRAEEG